LFVQGGLHFTVLSSSKLIHRHSLSSLNSQTSLFTQNQRWPNKMPVHPSSRPIIYQAITTILLLTPASAHLSAQQYDSAPEFVAAVEAEESTFACLAAFG